MKNREEAYWQGYIQKQNEAVKICKKCKYRIKVRQLEEDKQKLIEKLEKRIKEITNNSQFNWVGSEWQENWVVEELEEILEILKGEKKNE